MRLKIKKGLETITVELTEQQRNSLIVFLQQNVNTEVEVQNLVHQTSMPKEIMENFNDLVYVMGKGFKKEEKEVSSIKKERKRRIKHGR